MSRVEAVATAAARSVIRSANAATSVENARSGMAVGVRVGRGVRVGQGVWVGHGVRVGQGVRVGRGVSVGHGVRVAVGALGVGVSTCAVVKAAGGASTWKPTSAMLAAPSPAPNHARRWALNRRSASNTRFMCATVRMRRHAGRHVERHAGQIAHFCQAKPRLATIMYMGRKDKGREICINCGQTFHKKLTSKELRCTKCRKAEKKAA